MGTKLLVIDFRSDGFLSVEGSHRLKPVCPPVICGCGAGLNSIIIIRNTRNSTSSFVSLARINSLILNSTLIQFRRYRHIAIPITVVPYKGQSIGLISVIFKGNSEIGSERQLTTAGSLPG